MTTLTLPTEPIRQETDPLQRPMMIFGRKKSGKSTCAAGLDPEHTLFLATEPGHSALTIMRTDVKSWEEFLEILVELKANPAAYPYKLLVVDTIDELARFCGDYVIRGLNTDAQGKAKIKGFVHVSDFEWGRGHDAVAQEFRLRIAQLCSLGMGVLFVSHAKEGIVKTRTGKEITKLSPDVGSKGLRNWLLGYVDVIAYADVIESDRGKQHVLQMAPSETVEAGARVPEGKDLPALIPLRAAELRAWLTEAAA